MAEEEIMTVSVLDRFPEMNVFTTHGNILLPNHYSGSWFILVANPADFTPVSTTDYVAVSGICNELKGINCETIGLSVDQLFSHIKWLEWIREKLGVTIDFPVIADFGVISSMLGLIHPIHGTNTVSAVFIVDPRGGIRMIIHYPPELGMNAGEIIRTIRALQLADEHKVLIPAGWPNSPILGDRVIERPPITFKEATAKMESKGDGKCEAYDWWFCHRKPPGGARKK